MTTMLPTTLRWMGGLGIATIAITRCVVLFTANVVFDVDPVFATERIAGFGPAASLWLDVLLLASCAIALAGEVLDRRGVSPWLFLLAAAPVPVIIVHGLDDAGDLWRGATWASAMFAAVTMMHLARDESIRRVVGALLIGVIAALLVRGVMNVTVEHDATVAQFESQKERFFGHKGWDPDSPNAKIYERRLRQRQPTGWFATTNIYGSLVGVGVVVFAGLAVAAFRTTRASGAVTLFGALSAASLAAVWLTDSLGALGATVIGAAVFAAGLLGARWLTPRRAGLLAIAVVLAVLVGIAVRGLILSEGFAGERSLLFRSFYWQGALSTVVDEPLTGVGPDGFQRAYLAHRPPRSPEEVTSAHAIFADWPACLGIFGVAWIALALVMTWRIGRGLVGAADARGEPGGVRSLGLVVLAGAVAIAVGLMAEAPIMDSVVVVTRLVGLAALLLTAILIMTLPAAAWRIALAAAAIVLLVHGNIEMTLVRPGAVVWAWTLIGLAAAAPAAVGSRLTAGVVAGALGAGAVSLALIAAVPASRQHQIMLDAARGLWAIAPPVTSTAEVQVAHRQMAAARLLEAEAAWPINPAPRRFAVDQLERAANVLSGMESAALLGEAAEALAPLLETRDPVGRVQAVFIHQRLAGLQDRSFAYSARAAAESLTEDDPNGLTTWLRFADLLHAQGDGAAAREAYRRVLEIDDAFELDPLKRLGVRERTRVEQRAGKG